MAVEIGPLQAIFYCHLVLTTWGMLSPWLPLGYLYYNAFFLLAILWGIHSKDRDEPIVMALITNFISIVMDVIMISCYYYLVQNVTVRFGAAMAILNVILRPVSIFILFRVYHQRTGNYGTLGIPGLDNYFSGSPHDGRYENIDRAPNYPQSVPQNTLDTGSPAHLGPHSNVDEKPVIP